MKRTLLITMIILLATLLAACGQTSDAASSATAAPSQATTTIPSSAPSAAPSEIATSQEDVASSDSLSQNPEEIAGGDTGEPLLPVGNLEVDEEGNVIIDPSETADNSNPKDFTAEDYDGLDFTVISNEWSDDDKVTYVTIEVQNDSEEKVSANSDLFVAITFDQSLAENTVDADFTNNRTIMPGGKAKFNMSYDLRPQDIAGFALLKGYGEDPLRAILTNSVFSGK